MKRKIFVLIGIIAINCVINLNGNSILSENGMIKSNICDVHAQNQEVEYEYDSLGRVSAVRYQNGTQIVYEYDANGNLKYSGAPKKEEQDNGGGQSGNNQQSGGNSGNKSDGKIPAPKPPVVSNPSRETVTDIKNYNNFKKKKPVIKSLKKSKSKKKYYLKIQIKQINKKGTYGETGYQIKYAFNKKFKKAKTVKVTRNKKSSITSKKWKVKKGKTYYVKVRAVMKTKTGKTIYSKYSKTKKLKINK